MQVRSTPDAFAGPAFRMNVNVAEEFGGKFLSCLCTGICSALSLAPQARLSLAAAPMGKTSWTYRKAG